MSGEKCRSAYIHIPFCMQKCLYCDFNSFDNKDYLIDNYISSLIKEIKLNNINELYTTYIGGGTPSYIDGEYISKILELLPKSIETTIEINPGTISKEKLVQYKKSGINRVSIGLQTTDDSILKTIGRIHNLKEFEESYYLIRNEGFDNVSVDLMFGLPNQNLDIFKKSVEYLIQLKPEHISAYSLILHKNIFENLPSDEEEREMYHYLVKRLKDAGYNHYEISNFAFDGYESKHNITYWKQNEYYGLGAGASSFIDRKRYTNLKDIEKYINYINNNNDTRVLEEELNDNDIINEYMMLGLRMIEGINIKEANEKFNIDILKKYNDSLKKLQDFKLIEINDFIRLTDKGLDLANIVWEEFV